MCENWSKTWSNNGGRSTGGRLDYILFCLCTSAEKVRNEKEKNRSLHAASSVREHAQGSLDYDEGSGSWLVDKTPRALQSQMTCTMTVVFFATKSGRKCQVTTRNCIKLLEVVMDWNHETMEGGTMELQAVAASVARKTIEEEKAQFSKKREALKKQFEHEKRKCTMQIETVFKATKSSIEELLSNKGKEIREMIEKMEQEHSDKVQKTCNDVSERWLDGKTTAAASASKPRSALQQKACASCGKSDSSLLLCGGCGSTWYCNRSCQAKDWDKHQETCRPQQLPL